MAQIIALIVKIAATLFLATLLLPLEAQGLTRGSWIYFWIGMTLVLFMVWT